MTGDERHAPGLASGPEPALEPPRKATLPRCAVLGHPVAHSRSPAIHARFAAQTGVAMAYERLLCPLDGFAATARAWAASGARGGNVTVPFKFEALALVAAAGGRVSERAQRAQAANVLGFEGEDPARWWADNSDGIGLVRDIENGSETGSENVSQSGSTPGRRTALRGARLLLVGAGGAAAGVLGPLIEAGVAELVVANRTPGRAQALVQSHEALARQLGCALRAAALPGPGTGFDVVVNASSSSLVAAEVPVAASVLRPGSLAIDLMYGAAAEPFLAWARSHGAQSRDGLGMLVEQAAQSFYLWFGQMPETAPVLASLRAEIEAGA